MTVIPPHNTRALPVVPFVSETPMLRLVSGKAVAVGEEGCSEHLQSEESLWIDALGGRRLHAPLPVIRGPHCFRNKWVMVDSAAGASCVLPKLSSVATRIATPTQFSGALMLYCVDASKLNPSAEDPSVLDLLLGSADRDDVGESGIRRLLSRTVFVLTHSDYIFEVEDDVQSVLRKESSASTPIRSIGELRDYFLSLLRRTFPGCTDAIHADRILTFSGRNALLTKRILMYESDVQELYDYCEIMFGASFMQTVDTVEIDHLRRMVQRFAQETMLKKSGASDLTEQIRLFDFNATSHLLRDNGDLAMDVVEQLDRALERGKPAVLRDVVNYRSELECLVKETSWVLESSEKISAYSTKMSEEVTDVSSRCLRDFFQERLHELRYVLEGRPLVWFSERQACTIMDMKSALAKLAQFTEQYMLQRGFLEKKVREQRASAGGFDFIDQNAKELLRAMEKEKQELLHTLNVSIAHHVKDEFTRFLPRASEKVKDQQRKSVDEFIHLSSIAVTETANRIREQLDLDSLGKHLVDVPLIEENDRRLKNFLRELPEHVAVAAVEISNQWYVAIDDEELSNPKIPSKREQYERRLKAATKKDGDVEDESEFKMPTDLLYVLEAWRLSFAVIQMHQLCTFNIHTFTNGITLTSERVLDFVNRLVGSLESGALTQKEDVMEAERVVAEVDVVRVELQAIRTTLAGVLDDIHATMVHDLATAEEIVQSVEL
ncbi:Hypothetical protein, putative [Bodo saltans]|uniref:Uncharacterized protein n=1 Tax=Bodo saltans TaxID=75058 RepID=A0A0S4J5K4_BODSA|nr:Hypothetical protein, putative [Bodo saltans]|eukprot:CUG83922.1 Hypothetical protein, putative [Bodo saltans]